MSHRLFVAIRPSDAIIDAMLDTMQDSGDGIENARWQGKDQLHLTLRFIGEVDTPVANDIADALANLSTPAFDLTFEGVGHFERKHWPSVLWVGVAASPELDVLQKKIERAVVSAGIEPETRRFSPHVTLARLNRSSGDIGSWMAQHGDFACAPMRVDHFTLYESTLTRTGSHYDPVVRFALI